MNNLHMNYLQKYLSTCLLATAALVGASPALATHNFANFAVLSGTAVTCTDSKVTGDVGVSPGTVITQTRCTISGALHSNDGAAAAAFLSFQSAYATLASASSTPCGGTLLTPVTQTLAPGVYCAPTAVTFTGVTLTLNGPANGIWIFKVGTAGTGALTGTSFNVVMAGGGQACNVKWWVAQAATLTTSVLQGTIYAGAAITATDSILNGDALAGATAAGAVTLTRSIVADCSAPSGFSALPICAKPDRDGDDEDENDHDRDHDKNHRDHDKDHDGDHDRK